jgi:hypothetical protein
MASVTEMQPLAPSGYRRAPEMKEKVESSFVDLEAGNGETLYPGISRGENALRWGFIRKVYGILCAQLLLTTVVSAVTVFHPTLNATLSSSPVLALLLAVVPFIRKCSPRLGPSDAMLDLTLGGVYVSFL